MSTCSVLKPVLAFFLFHINILLYVFLSLLVFRVSPSFLFRCIYEQNTHTLWFARHINLHLNSVLDSHNSFGQFLRNESDRVKAQISENELMKSREVEKNNSDYVWIELSIGFRRWVTTNWICLLITDSSSSSWCLVWLTWLIV